MNKNAELNDNIIESVKEKSNQDEYLDLLEELEQELNSDNNDQQLCPSVSKIYKQALKKLPKSETTVNAANNLILTDDEMSFEDEDYLSEDSYEDVYEVEAGEGSGFVLTEEEDITEGKLSDKVRSCFDKPYPDPNVIFSEHAIPMSVLWTKGEGRSRRNAGTFGIDTTKTLNNIRYGRLFKK